MVFAIMKMSRVRDRILNESNETNIQNMARMHEESRRKNGEFLKNKYLDENERIKTSKIQKEHYKNHPERRLNHSKFMNEYWKKSNRNPSEEMLEYCKTHPEKQLKQSISMKKHYESTEARELTGKLSKEYYKDPNHRKCGKEYMRCRFTKVDQYTKDMKFIKTFDCVQEAADEVGVTAPNIFQCIYGKGKTSAGFIWKKHEAK